MPRKQKWREKNKDDLDPKIPEPPLSQKRKKKEKARKTYGNEYQLIMLQRKQNAGEKRRPCNKRQRYPKIYVLSNKLKKKNLRTLTMKNV